MTSHYNKPSEKENRRHLRRNQTISEKLVWMYLKNRQTKGIKFRRQYSVDKYVIDFYCPELKLAIEIDGDVHDLPCQKEYDIIRQNYLQEFGIKFIRIRNEELSENANKAFGKIESEIEKIINEMAKINES
jgi:very-short-patch-repair endonuclease